MSVHVSSLVWKLDCPHGTKLVLLKLADCANDDGRNVFPFVETVAQECGCTGRTVQRILKIAKAAGWLLDDKPVNRANRYRFDLEKLRSDSIEPARVTECHPSENRTMGDIDDVENVTNVTPRVTHSHPHINRQVTIKEPGIRAGAADPPPGWIDFVSAYPERSGPKKEGEAKRLFDSAVASGVDPERIVAGAKRYAEWCRKTGKIGKELVQQMRTFLRESAWEEEFEVQEQDTEAPRPKLVVGNDGLARYVGVGAG